MKVLLVDDSLTTRQFLLYSLQKWKYEVVAAENGQQAWELFEQGDFPLVLTDWIMPGMDGLELIRRIRASERLEYVYIILLTSKSEKEDLVRAMEAGADDFLVKPPHPDELRVRIHEGQRIVNLERALAEQNRKLREAQVALLQTEKLASLGQLAAGMAHEINNPVAYVTNNLAVLKRELTPLVDLLHAYRRGTAAMAEANPALADELARLEEAIDPTWIEKSLPRLLGASLEGLGRVRDLIQNLRDFARLDAAELDEVDLVAALQSTLEVLRHESEAKRLEIQTSFGALPPVVCRPRKLNQVFHNVLLNAIQASPPGGVIQVRLSGEEGEARVEVQDGGCGIPTEHLPHLFEPFFTTKGVGEGKGLGLAICYGILRDHGGSIEAESQPGRGSLFRIRLPVVPPLTPGRPTGSGR